MICVERRGGGVVGLGVLVDGLGGLGSVVSVQGASSKVSAAVEFDSDVSGT